MNRLTARLSLERKRGDDVMMMASAELGISGLMLGHWANVEFGNLGDASEFRANVSLWLFSYHTFIVHIPPHK